MMQYLQISGDYNLITAMSLNLVMTRFVKIDGTISLDIMLVMIVIMN